MAFLRANTPGLRVAHAHEIVAAFFGYKSNIALKSDAAYPIDDIAKAQTMVPDVEGIKTRLAKLIGLPAAIPSAFEIADMLTRFLVDNGWFGGTVWLYETVENYVTEVYLVEKDYEIMNQLSGVMAETNAYFDEAYFEEVEVTRTNDGMIIEAAGQYYGSNDPDRVFAGDTIDMTATIKLDRVAGHTCFGEEDFMIGGELNDDWYEDA
ncbi:hypothetical protein [Pseudogemmobacter humi]|uniref:hypothetical protein n=1 Tax=Pseudogemmobacter humi TaxID=2483812 RepID=UPI000F52CC98|nr:hypothetical protein [Pseudogemmobacter humi]